MHGDQTPVVLPFVDEAKMEGILQHPIAPLTAGEIAESSKLIKALWPADTNFQFKVITLQEPKKTELVPFLAAEHEGKKTPLIERRSFVVYYIRNTVIFTLVIGYTCRRKVGN
jgi:primary-amine oxidase